MTSRLERLLELDSKIRRGNYPSLSHLCASFSVKPRTIYEDIKILRERLGLQIEFDRARNGYFNACPDKTLPVFDLSINEFILLTAALESFGSNLQSCGIKDKVSAISQKIAERMAQPINFAAISDTIQCQKADGNSKSADNFLSLAKACVDRSRIEIEYRTSTFNEVERICLQPLNLVESDRTWSLKALAEHDGQTVSYELERIESIRVISRSSNTGTMVEPGEGSSYSADSKSGTDLC